MPNNITNRLTINCGEEKRREILEAIQMEEKGLGSIDFEKIIPMPDNVYRGDLSSTDRELYGKDNWYDWSVGNWSTKWNSYGYEDFPEYSGGDEIRFYTAWSPPEPVIRRLSEMYPEVEFRHAWADEDIGMNVGEVTYANGEYAEYDVPKGGTKEAYEMAAEIRDVELSDYNLYYSFKKGNYEYRNPDKTVKIRPNALGVTDDTPTEKQLPDAPIIGADGNVFNVIGIASRVLKRNGMSAEAKEMSSRAFMSGSYVEALGIITEYVNPVSVDDFNQSPGMTMR